jgi:DNA-binding LytR/AlgR family response regulator
MRILLVDDEPLALDRLSTLLEGRQDVSVVGRASNAAEAVEAVEALKPDLLLLDIRMPDQDGLSLARTLATNPAVEVIFVTAFDQFAAEAFNIDAIDYLLKPVEPDRLTLALAKAVRRRSLPAEPALEQVKVAPGATWPYVSSLWVPKRNGFARIDIDTIEWIEAARDYVLIHTATHSHILRATMDSLSRQFDPQVMIRASRSAFVRRGAVTALERQGRDGLFLVLSDRACVRVGTTYAKAIEGQLGFRPDPAA